LGKLGRATHQRVRGNRQSARTRRGNSQRREVVREARGQQLEDRLVAVVGVAVHAQVTQSYARWHLNLFRPRLLRVRQQILQHGGDDGREEHLPGMT
jgi:hypothetical protein